MRSFTDHPSGKYPGSSICAGVSDSIKSFSSTQPASSAACSSRFVAMTAIIAAFARRRIPRDPERFGDELEGLIPDQDFVSPARSRLLETALHSGSDQTPLQLHHLPGVVQIHLGDPALHPLAGDAKTIALPSDHERLAGGT